MNYTSSRLRSSSQPAVSLIVPMRNEAAQAEACLDSLAKLTYAPLEIVVVDDRSSDDTAAIVRKLIANDARFKLISLETEPGLNWSGKARAADAGIKATSGGLIVVADADVRHAPLSVEASVRALEAREFVVGVPRAIGHGPASWCARYEYELLYLASDQGQCFAFGAYAAFHRSLYERIGGWGSAPGHPEVMALAWKARALGTSPALVRRDDLSMEQFQTVGEATRALVRNTNYRFAPPRPMVRTAAILSLFWVGLSLVLQGLIVGGAMLLCYCGLIAFSWRRYGASGIFGGFCFAVPGALWFTSVSLGSMLWQALGGTVVWRGRSFVR